MTDPVFILRDVSDDFYIQAWGRDQTKGHTIYTTDHKDQAFLFVRSEVHALFNCLAICAMCKMVVTAELVE